jgi:hypothetical protein
MTTMTDFHPLRAFTEGTRDARAKQYDRLDEKALRKARKRGLHTATILATGRKEYEGLLNRGWTLVEAHGQQTIWDVVRRYEMTKRVLGH